MTLWLWAQDWAGLVCGVRGGVGHGRDRTRREPPGSGAGSKQGAKPLCPGKAIPESCQHPGAPPDRRGLRAEPELRRGADMVITGGH